MKKEKKGKLRIIPLGGLEQIGMNITADRKIDFFEHIRQGADVVLVSVGDDKALDLGSIVL